MAEEILDCEAELFEWILHDLERRSLQLPTMQDRINEYFGELA